jgi:hypothetical protein
VTEADLLRKLSAIEALIAGATTPGEREAAESAKNRISSRIKEAHPASQDFHFSIPDVWARKLFIALASRAGLSPFRYRGQRRTTLVLHCRPSQQLLIWSQFREAERQLRQYLDEVTTRVIQQAVGATTDDVKEHAAAGALLAGGGSENS